MVIWVIPSNFHSWNKSTYSRSCDQHSQPKQMVYQGFKCNKPFVAILSSSLSLIPTRLTKIKIDQLDQFLVQKDKILRKSPQKKIQAFSYKPTLKNLTS
jgi:hypothetical protein